MTQIDYTTLTPKSDLTIYQDDQSITLNHVSDYKMVKKLLPELKAATVLTINHTISAPVKPAIFALGKDIFPQVKQLTLTIDEQKSDQQEKPVKIDPAKNFPELEELTIEINSDLPSCCEINGKLTGLTNLKKLTVSGSQNHFKNVTLPDSLKKLTLTGITFEKPIDTMVLDGIDLTIDSVPVKSYLINTLIAPRKWNKKMLDFTPATDHKALLKKMSAHKDLKVKLCGLIGKKDLKKIKNLKLEDASPFTLLDIAMIAAKRGELEIAEYLLKQTEKTILGEPQNTIRNLLNCLIFSLKNSNPEQLKSSFNDLDLQELLLDHAAEIFTLLVDFKQFDLAMEMTETMAARRTYSYRDQITVDLAFNTLPPQDRIKAFEKCDIKKVGSYLRPAYVELPDYKKGIAFLSQEITEENIAGYSNYCLNLIKRATEAGDQKAVQHWIDQILAIKEPKKLFAKTALLQFLGKNDQLIPLFEGTKGFLSNLDAMIYNIGKLKDQSVVTYLLDPVNEQLKSLTPEDQYDKTVDLLKNLVTGGHSKLAAIYARDLVTLIKGGLTEKPTKYAQIAQALFQADLPEAAYELLLKIPAARSYHYSMSFEETLIEQNYQNGLLQYLEEKEKYNEAELLIKFFEKNVI